MANNMCLHSLLLQLRLGSCQLVVFITKPLQELTARSRFHVLTTFLGTRDAAQLEPANGRSANLRYCNLMQQEFHHGSQVTKLEMPI